MWDDILELILWIFDDIIDFSALDGKRKRRKRNVRKKLMKNKEKLTEKDLYKRGVFIWMIMNT